MEGKVNHSVFNLATGEINKMIKEILDQIADNVSNFFVFSCNMTYNKIHYTIAPMLLFYCLPVKYRYCTEYICYQTSHFTVQPTPYSKF